MTIGTKQRENSLAKVLVPIIAWAFTECRDWLLSYILYIVSLCHSGRNISELSYIIEDTHTIRKTICAKLSVDTGIGNDISHHDEKSGS